MHTTLNTSPLLDSGFCVSGDFYLHIDEDSQIQIHRYYCTPYKESDLQSFQCKIIQHSKLLPHVAPIQNNQPLPFHHSERRLKLICYMFKDRRRAGLKTLSIQFVPSKIKLYRKLLYTSKFMLKLMDQCPSQNLSFPSYTPLVLEDERHHALWNCTEPKWETTAQLYAGHTLPLEAEGLFHSLKSHNTLQVLPLVVHCPHHDITLKTLDTSSLGNQTGSGQVTAWTEDTRCHGLPKLGQSWDLDAMPRATRRASAATSAEKTKKWKHRLIAQWSGGFDDIETEKPTHPVPSLPHSTSKFSPTSVLGCKVQGADTLPGRKPD